MLSSLRARTVPSRLFPKARRTTTTRSYPTRPGSAVKPVLDIKHMRQNPGLYEQNSRDRNYESQARNAWDILRLHEEKVILQHDARGLRERSKTVRRELAKLASSPDSHDRTNLINEAKSFQSDLDALSVKEQALESEMESLAWRLPNLSSPHTPSGPSPLVLSTINEHPLSDPSSSDRVWRGHTEIGRSLGILDSAAASSTSGWGWYFLLGPAVQLEHALVQYSLHVARRRRSGWTLVSPPSVVYGHVAAACGYQPRDVGGETQIYALQTEAGKPGLVLAGTAEIPFAGMQAAKVIGPGELPLKVIGSSRCYRAEAGARGMDTKGLYRVHEFTKVEMFAWTGIDGSPGEEGTFFDGKAATGVKSKQDVVFEEVVEIQKEIIGGLGLHGRVLEMPATDLGASAQRKIDIEVWFPGRRGRDDGWGEVTSASMCGDYQTRRLGTRLKAKDGKLDWPFTVNGTAMAVPRVLAAILEMGWDEGEQLVRIPEVLWPWMEGERTIKSSLPGSSSSEG